MTLWLTHWLRAFSPILPTSARPKYPALDTSRFSARDLADLNLPPDVAGSLAARQAGAELRRRVAW